MHPALPLTDLLSVLNQPAALVAASGSISWRNPAFEALFRPDAPPQSFAEWEGRSPPGPGSAWEELTRRHAAVRRLASGLGIGVFQLTLLPDEAGGGVLLCNSTSARRTLQELRERTTLLEAIFHSLNEGVLALDAQERIVAFSLSAERITGFAEAEVLGRECRDVFQMPAVVECPFQAMIRSQQGFHKREMEVRGRDGRSVHVAVNATLLRDAEGAVDGAVVVLRDLSEVDRLREQIDSSGGFHGIVGRHATVRRVIEKMETVAPSDASILILGESGTGKELAAKAIHALCNRRRGPFVKVNCGALADPLLESELFGHVRGAFTGAVKDRPGRFEAAHGGTLFLDEIGDTSPALQVKLLRVLQEGEFERLGETQTRRADVRIVAATHRDLRKEIAQGRFREDLFYRLCVVPIQLPPLRERKEDIPFLANHFLKRLDLKEGRRKALSTSVHPLLEAYEWPGNVRELENAIAHAYVCTAGDVISAEALPEHLLRTRPGAEPQLGEELQAIYEILNQVDWNKGEAARRLGLSRTTLWRRMRDLGIRDRRRAPGRAG